MASTKILANKYLLNFKISTSNNIYTNTLFKSINKLTKAITLYNFNIKQIQENNMWNELDEGDLLIIYLGMLLGIWIISMFKSIIIQIMTGEPNNEFFCPELIIAITITQIYMILANKKINVYDSYLTASLFNILLTTIAWRFGTNSGGRALALHPSQMLIKILLSFIF